MPGQGRKKTPTAILKARGSWRAKLRELEGEPPYDAGTVTCPDWLGREGKAEWRRQIVQLQKVGVLAVTDRALLAAFCQAWDEIAQASKEINKAQKADPSISLRDVWPLIKIRAEAQARLHRYACEFGFTPASRSRVKVPEKKQQGDDFEQFVARRQA